MSPVLSFVTETMDVLLARQSARLGGAADGQLCLTVTRPIHRDYRSLGHLKPDGTHQTYWFPSLPMDLAPTLLDFDLWPILQRLSAQTGDPQYTDLAEGMAAAFAPHGFDARCGLGYLGEEAGFDVERLACVSTKTRSAPHFKPRNSGAFPGLPLDTLWRHAPAQMHRMCRAMYTGLVTHADSMDFNRFCDYDFDDGAGRPAMTRCAHHCAFESCAARMIHWWANCFAETGDEDCLRWAERMADKWAAIQHRDSGLVPNFFGAMAPQENAPMPPGEWTETRGAAMMASGLMDAVGELRRAGADAFADRLQNMTLRLARGVARYTYDPERRIFREHLHLDGTPYAATARYVFHTAEEKAAAVRHDPDLAQVPVYVGAGFYRPSTYWEYCAGVNTPADLAVVAAATGDPDLGQLLAPWAEEAVAASRQAAEPLTPDGAWTFRASAYGIKLLVLLSRARRAGCQSRVSGTDGDPAGLTPYVAWAREIADAELTRLARPAEGDWWRMPDRTAFLDALQLLQDAHEPHAAPATSS